VLERILRRRNEYVPYICGVVALNAAGKHNNVKLAVNFHRPLDSALPVANGHSLCVKRAAVGIILMYQRIGEGSSTSHDGAHEPDYILRLYAAFSTVTAAFIALITLSSLVVTIKDTSFSSFIAIVHLVLRAYSLLFMLIAFLCEMEWLEAIRQSAVFQSWIFRGVFFSYLGLFSYVEYANFEIDKSRYSWLVEAFSLSVFVSGVIYTILVSTFTLAALDNIAT
jgi:uncharacterized membrane protein